MTGETTTDVTAEVAGRPITWTKRRVLVRSRRMQAAQSQALERRLQLAEADLQDLLVARRGKTRPTIPKQADAAIVALVERQGVVGLLTVTLTSETHSRPLRA